MNYAIKINAVKTMDELEGSWTNADLIELLKRFNYADADKVKPNELKDFLFMAITDFEPEEAAAIMMDYRLSEALNEGQIHNLSYEMLREKVSENYSDIYIHKSLFTINQLLFKAYNGKFPSAKAVVVAFEMKPEHAEETPLTKELALKALRVSLSESNLINRLYKPQLDGIDPFPEADGIIWDLEKKGDDQYVMTTSEKWLNEEDFEKKEYACSVMAYSEKGDEA